MDIAPLIWQSRSRLQQNKIQQKPALDFPGSANIEVFGECAKVHDLQRIEPVPVASRRAHGREFACSTHFRWHVAHVSPAIGVSTEPIGRDGNRWLRPCQQVIVNCRE
jgi:hypothetical protein